MNKWKIQFTRNSLKELQKLDKPIYSKIINELDEIIKLNNPRKDGKSLTGNLDGLWRYRVGNYRIIAEIKDSVLTVIIVKIAHRKEVYK